MYKPRGVLWLFFAGYVPLASQRPRPIIDPILVTFGQMYFRDPNLVTQSLFMYLPYQSLK